MRKYVCDPNLQVKGVTLDSIVRNIESQTIVPVMEAHGITDIDHEAWYPVAMIFNAFNDLMEQNGGNTQVFVAMGMRIAEQSEFPPEMKTGLTLISMLEGWHAHYEANHRGAPLPPVATIKVNDQHYQLVLQGNHLYPFNLVYGMVYGFCRQLLPQGSTFLVEYDDTHTPYGDYGDKVIINVSWE